VPPVLVLKGFQSAPRNWRTLWGQNSSPTETLVLS
jgi:hypothetical protein